MKTKEKISKKDFYNNGGFSNPNLYRKATKKGYFEYYRKIK